MLNEPRFSSLDFVSTYTQTIELSTGWGIWSTYIDPADPNMASVFADIVDNLTIVKDENGSVYWPMFGLNSIGELTDGKGYQAKMIEDAVMRAVAEIEDVVIFDRRCCQKCR